MDVRREMAESVDRRGRTVRHDNLSGLPCPRRGRAEAGRLSVRSHDRLHHPSNLGKRATARRRHRHVSIPMTADAARVGWGLEKGRLRAVVPATHRGRHRPTAPPSTRPANTPGELHLTRPARAGLRRWRSVRSPSLSSDTKGGRWLIVCRLLVAVLAVGSSLLVAEPVSAADPSRTIVGTEGGIRGPARPVRRTRWPRRRRRSLASGRRSRSSSTSSSGPLSVPT